MHMHTHMNSIYYLRVPDSGEGVGGQIDEVEHDQHDKVRDIQEVIQP